MKRSVVIRISINKISFADKVDFPRPNKCHAPNIKHMLNSVCVTTGTLVLIRLHKKADLPEMKVNCTKDRKVCVDENKF